MVPEFTPSLIDLLNKIAVNYLEFYVEHINERLYAIDIEDDFFFK